MVDLHTQVANALHWDLAVPRHRVTAEVDHDLVTLHGVVDRPEERTCAEATARRVPGVRDVRNEISVRGGGTAS